MSIQRHCKRQQGRSASEERGVGGRHRVRERMTAGPSSLLAGSKIKSIDVDMLIRLSKLKRLRAGWLLALVYLLCVLAPTLSFALPGSQAAAPCLIDASHMPGMVH